MLSRSRASNVGRRCASVSASLLVSGSGKMALMDVIVRYARIIALRHRLSPLCFVHRAQEHHRVGQVEEETTTQAGVALTNALIERCSPLVDGKPLSLVIEAFCAAMIGILMSCQGVDRRGVAMRYCARALLLADDVADDDRSELE